MRPLRREKALSKSPNADYEISVLKSKSLSDNITTDSFKLDKPKNQALNRF
jgi:hypothetical protein